MQKNDYSIWFVELGVRDVKHRYFPVSSVAAYSKAFQRDFDICWMFCYAED